MALGRYSAAIPSYLLRGRTKSA